MAQKQKRENPDEMISMPVVNPHAAGIDAGSRFHFVCVAQNNVRGFKSHTGVISNKGSFESPWCQNSCVRIIFLYSKKIGVNIFVELPPKICFS
jgi:hypothetical protein